MRFRKFEITLISANNLKKVRDFLDMKVYAKVSIAGIADTELKTSVDMKGQTNPRWNYKMVFAVDEATLIREEDTILSIKLYCQRTFKPDKYVGEVDIPLKGLLDSGLINAENLTYNVGRCDSQGIFGKLHISYYTFGETLTVEEEQDPYSGRESLSRAALDGAKLLIAGAIHLIIFFVTIGG